jgi:transposase
MIPHGVEIFIGLEPIDLRWGFERLSGLVERRLERPARSGALFVFFGKRRTALKVLFYDGTGLCLFYKRLDQGCFQVPKGLEEGATHLVVEEHVLEELLDGLRVEAPRRGPRPH